MDILPGHQTQQLEINMMPGLMNVETSRRGLFRHYPSYLKYPISVQKHVQQPTSIDYNKLKPYFQQAVTSARFPMRKPFKSRLPAFNIPRRKEAVATDSIISDS